MSEQSICQETLENTFRDVLFLDEELRVKSPPDGAVIVEGIVSTFGFHPGRLESHRDEIRAMLAELPDQFQKRGGGGWSFLNACHDRNGNQWTGEHRTMEMLVCLGIGLGLAGFQLPRELWPALPGGMPYFVIDLEAKAE